MFLLDGQRPSVLETSENPDSEDRSYVFLLCGPDGGDQGVVRVPLPHLVIGLLTHQILLQTVGAILLQGSPHLVPRSVAGLQGMAYRLLSMVCYGSLCTNLFTRSLHLSSQLFYSSIPVTRIGCGGWECVHAAP